MIPTVNFHTHSKFCDGKNTVEEVVIEAIKKGFTELGFSGHGYTTFDIGCCMSKENTKRYIEEINSLKNKYRNDIKLFCGIEADYYTEFNYDDFDYVIGSVHYVEKDGVYHFCDYSKEHLINTVNTGWNGDMYAFIEDYFLLVSDVVNKTNADIIGHFDLVRKYNEDGSLFSEENPRYIKAATNAAEKLKLTNRVFEINTGAICRGYTTKPYPSDYILGLLSGSSVVISSDCHEKSKLDFYFKEAAEAAEKHNLTVINSMDEIKKFR